MSQVLSGLDFCYTYLDDILICNSSWKEYLHHPEVVFKHLKEANIKLKLSKCQFFKRHFHYLGHLISQQGVQPLPKKVSAIQHIKEPSNVEELQNFLSLAGYYRKFMLLIPDVTKPLNLRKDTKFHGSPQC